MSKKVKFSVNEYAILHIYKKYAYSYFFGFIYLNIIIELNVLKKYINNVALLLKIQTYNLNSLLVEIGPPIVYIKILIYVSFIFTWYTNKILY